MKRVQKIINQKNQRSTLLQKQQIMGKSSKEDGVDMRNYNIGTLCEFTIKNFWKKIDRKNTPAEVLKEKYHEFYITHLQEIDESVRKLSKKNPFSSR